MHLLAAVLALLCLAEARPRRLDVVPSMSVDPYIIGGTEATPHEFPWQLSQQRLSGGIWSHSCGCSLLRPNVTLTAAHCVDGALVAILQVVAGLHLRSNESNAQISGVLFYTKHESYGVGSWTYPNDIALITLVKPFILSEIVALLALPPDNSNLFVGFVCVLTGWGRNSSSNSLPDALQKVNSTVISTAECNTRMAPISGASCDDSQIAVYDASNAKGSCNGDSGGPMNCHLGEITVVAGVTSWVISGGGACLPSYPSVYTRTSHYLSWIYVNAL